MLTREENELLTQVDRGTPCGELLRRYWHPVATAAELSEEKPIRSVNILGEELVVYRDKKGRYGLVSEHCPHRLASLAYGRVDEERAFAVPSWVEIRSRRQMSRTAGGAGGQYVQRPDQTCCLSGRVPRRADLRLSRAGARAASATLGRAGLKGHSE